MILTPNPKNLLPRPESGHSPDPAPYPDITLLTPSPIHSAFTCEVSSHSFLKFSFCVHFFNFFFLVKYQILYTGDPWIVQIVCSLGIALWQNHTNRVILKTKNQFFERLFFTKKVQNSTLPGICI